MTDAQRQIPLTTVSAAANAAESPERITRRVALQGLAGGLGLAVGAASAGAAEQHHPLAAHLAQRRATPARAAAAPFTPQFLDAHQFATLTCVADLIVPGALASGSPRYIDEVLAIESDQVRRTFVTALAALDAAARDEQASTFVALPGARQIALLEAAAAVPPPSAPAAPPAPEASVPTTAAPRAITLNTPLAVLKTWVAGAHFSSEAGMKELGFTGAVFFPTFPACTHPEGHQ